MSNAVTASPTTDASIGEPTRRDFLYVATAAVGAVGALTTAWPLIQQMNPDATTIAEGGPVDLNVGQLLPGQQVVVQWRKKPVLVINRPAKTLEILNNPDLLARLADPLSKKSQQPPYAENWHRSVKPEYAVLLGVCTHLGCIPTYRPDPNPKEPASNWLGGYWCTCHGSLYDLAGRVFKDVPAPHNLAVPPYYFVDDATIRIGENPRRSID